MRRITSLLLIFALILGMFGCDSNKSAADELTVYLIGPTDGEQSIVPQQVKEHRGGRSEETAMYALLHPGKTAENLRSPFVDGVSCLGIAYDQSSGALCVELNEKYLDMTGVQAAEAECCTALTMAEYGYPAVRLLVNGRPHPKGSDVVRAADIVYEEIGGAALEREITLYFRSEENGRLFTEKRGIIIREGEPVEKYVVDELVKGSSNSYKSVLPDGLKLREAATDGDVCLLNFSREFEKILDGPVDVELPALVSIANSIIDSSSANGVRFLVEGEPVYRGLPLYKSDGAGDSYSYAAFEVWLPSNDGEHVEPAQVVIPADSTLSSDRLLLNWLKQGVDGAGFFSPLPTGTEILRATSSQNIYYIDFSAEFAENITDDGRFEQALKSIVHTLYHNGYAHNGLDISVEGVPFRYITAATEDIHPDFR